MLVAEVEGLLVRVHQIAFVVLYVSVTRSDDVAVGFLIRQFLVFFSCVFCFLVALIVFHLLVQLVELVLNLVVVARKVVKESAVSESLCNEQLGRVALLVLQDGEQQVDRFHHGRMS